MKLDDDVIHIDDNKIVIEDELGTPLVDSGVGFFNPKNKGFFNSILIFLSHIELLTDTIHSRCTSNVEFNVAKEYLDSVKCFDNFIKNIWSKQYKNYPPNQSEISSRLALVVINRKIVCSFILF